ncbi:MAG TPA: hypothetical protein VF543_02975 [Pyrinomonadaceae bacterium]|jgi:hypothetical protein
MAIKPKKPMLGNDEDFESLVHNVVRSCGSFRPETVEDVLRAEAEGLDRSEEPRRRRARDPYDLLRLGPKGSYKLRPLCGDANDVEQKVAAMARAARAGREIPADVEEQMKKDKEAAKRQRRD